jgi:hypothetical protein
MVDEDDADARRGRDGNNTTNHNTNGAYSDEDEPSPSPTGSASARYTGVAAARQGLETTASRGGSAPGSRQHSVDGVSSITAGLWPAGASAPGAAGSINGAPDLSITVPGSARRVNKRESDVVNAQIKRLGGGGKDRRRQPTTPQQAQSHVQRARSARGDPSVGASSTAAQPPAMAAVRSLASNQLSASLPVTDLPRHLHRLHLAGTNSPASPLRLLPRIPPELAGVVLEREYVTQLLAFLEACDQCGVQIRGTRGGCNSPRRVGGLGGHHR